METIYWLILGGFFLVLFGIILFFPKKKVKTKEEKQQEIYENYRKILQEKLLHVEADKYSEIKTNLLKSFAKELEFNIFYDRNEIFNLIKKLNEEF